MASTTTKTTKKSKATPKKKVTAVKPPAKKKAASKKTGEALRKDAITQVDKNIARIDGDKGAKTSTTKERKTKAATKPAKEKKPSGLDLAAQVLANSKEPLKAKEIAERAIAAGWKTNGKTPHATLYAAIIREITKKGKDARFEKADRGRFQVRKGGS